MHLASVGMFHRRDNEASSAQCDLTPGPSVHRQCQFPFADIEHARQQDTVGATNAARFTCRSIMEELDGGCWCHH